MDAKKVGRLVVLLVEKKVVMWVVWLVGQLVSSKVYWLDERKAEKRVERSVAMMVVQWDEK